MIWSIEILNIILSTQSNDRNCMVWPFVVAFPHAPNIEQEPLVN